MSRSTLSYGPMPVASTSHSVPRTFPPNFRSILDQSLDEYTKQTGVDLAKCDFAKKLETYNSLDEIVWLLKDKAKQFKEYRDGNRKLINCISPIAQTVHVFAGFLGEALSGSVSPYSPAKAVFVGIDILLVATNGVSSSYDALVDLFECIHQFLDRLRIYNEITFPDAMKDILVKIMVEVFSVLALATKQIKQGRFKKFAKKLFGESEIEAILQRLDRLTQEEARTTMAQTLAIVFGLVGNVKSVMNDNEVSMDGIRQALITMQGMASEINKMRRDQLQDKVRNWLSPPDPSTNHYAACESCQEGSAAWFFQGRVFTEWKATGSLLWIHGKPGSGKSTLLSSIIHDLDTKRAEGLASVSYYYFDFRDIVKQHRHGLLSSLLVQLCVESDPCHDVLFRLYSVHANGTRRPTDVSLTHCLKEMLECQGQLPTYIVVDAIDECPNASGFPTAREKVLEFVESLVGLQLPNLRICVASRPESDIRDALEPLTPLRVSLHEERGQKMDIRNYVTRTVCTDKRMCKWREEDKKLVIEILSEQSDGMFRWACCQLESLRDTLAANIRGALDELPKSLDETYERILLNIDEEKRDYAQRIFQCLTASARPLQVEELAEVLAIRFKSDSLPNHNARWRSGDAKEAVLSACSSLITVSKAEGSQVVQFAHFSVKEFLTSTRLATMGANLSRYHILSGPAHTVLANACLSILLKLNSNIDKNVIKNSPLPLYAAQHWAEHVQFEDASSHIQDAIMRLFDSNRPHFAVWVWLYDMDCHWGKQMSTPHPTPPQASPLYYAVLCGFYGLVERLVRTNPSDINARGGHYKYVLHASLGRGDKKITRLLLEQGAKVDVRDNDAATPLHRACRAGNLDDVQQLLEHDADVHAQTAKQELPLHFAAGEGEAEICRLLLDRRTDMNSKDAQGWVPLHSASRYGHLEVVKLLLDRGVDVDTKTADEWTPLHLASANGKFEIVQLLIQGGATVDTRNDIQKTPLDQAAGNGNFKIAQFLISSGATVNVMDKRGRTPLHTAARNGSPDIAELLLKSGANLEVQNETQMTPLTLACRNGKVEVVRILIERGSDLNSRNKEGWNPLHYASRHGHVDVARLLLYHGVDVNVRKADDWTPLHLSAANGCLDIARLLIEHRALVPSRNERGETPLDRAAGNGHLEIVYFLIEHGASVNSRDNEGWTPFHTASKSGHLRVAKFLLDRGVDVDVRNGNDETSLDLASSSGKLDTARFLIDNHANVHTRDNRGWNPLHIASQNGHLDVVRLLIDSGTNVDIRNGSKKTPLTLASGKGEVKVALFLIQKGAEINARDSQSWTPLHFASRHGYHDMVQVLLDYGVDANVQKADLWTPLHLAAANGHIKVTQLLIQRGARVGILNSKRESPLGRAAGSGKVEIARILIDHGANVHAPDFKGWTPLHAASQGGHLEVVKLLLRHGADVEVVNNAKKTAGELASENNKAEVARFLAEYKADSSVLNKSRSSSLGVANQGADEDEKDQETAPLHAASEEGRLDIVRKLLDWGADINAPNSHSKTPLDLAVTRGNVDVVRLLIESGAEVNSRDKCGWTPLHKASRYGHFEISRMLVDNSAEVNAKNQDLWTPMHLAARNGYAKIVELLLQRGADTGLLNDEGRTSYQLSLGKGRQKVAELIRGFGQANCDG